MPSALAFWKVWLSHNNPVDGGSHEPTPEPASEIRQAEEAGRQSNIELEEQGVAEAGAADVTTDTERKEAGKERSLVDMCFISLFWAFVVVQVWQHIWLIHLLPVCFICLLLKKLGKFFFPRQTQTCLSCLDIHNRVSAVALKMIYSRAVVGV